MAEAIDELLVRLGLDVEAKGFKEANNQFAGLRTGALALGAVAITAGVGMVKMSDGVARSVDTLGKWSDAAGVSIRKAQQLKFALDQAGSANPESDMMSMFANVEDMRKRAMRGEIGGWELIETGINLNSLMSMNNEEGLDFLMRGVSDIADPERQRRALDEIGFSGVAQHGVMTNYDATQQAYRRSDELGNADEDLYEKSAAYTAAMGELSKAMDGFRQMVASQMLPGMTRFVEGVTDFSVENRDEIAAFFKEAMPYLQAAATGIGLLVAAQIGQKGVAALGGVGGAAGTVARAGIVGAALSTWGWNADDLEEATGIRLPDWIFKPIGEMGSGSSSTGKPQGKSHTSSGTLIRGSDGRVKHSLSDEEMNYEPSQSELIPQGNISDLIEGNRRLLPSYVPSLARPTASNSTTMNINVDARGSTDPMLTSERVRGVIRDEVGRMVNVSRDGIPNNVA